MKKYNVFSIVGPMGSGKTVSAVALAVAMLGLEDIPRVRSRVCKVYANFKIDAQNKSVYSAFPLPPINERNIMLIIDDIFAYPERMQRFVTLAVVNLSRKRSWKIITTAQRYVLIEKTIRELGYVVKPIMHGDSVDLLILEEEENGKFKLCGRLTIPQISRFFKYYDTEEAVEPVGPFTLARSLMQLDNYSRRWYMDVLYAASRPLHGEVKRLLSEGG